MRSTDNCSWAGGHPNSASQTQSVLLYVFHVLHVLFSENSECKIQEWRLWKPVIKGNNLGVMEGTREIAQQLTLAAFPKGLRLNSQHLQGGFPGGSDAVFWPPL